MSPTKKKPSKKAPHRKASLKPSRSRPATGKAAKSTPRSKAPNKKSASRPVFKKTAASRKAEKVEKVKATGKAPAPKSTVAVPPNKAMRSHKKDEKVLLDLYERGIKALYNKDYQQALELFEKVVENFPEETELADRARNFIKVCQSQGATKRVHPPKTVEEMFDLGVMEHNSGNYQKAIEHFKAAIEQNPKADYIHYALAASFAQSGDVDRAIHSLQKSIQLNSDNKFLGRNDPDFEPIRATKEFGAIVEMPRSE